MSITAPTKRTFDKFIAPIDGLITKATARFGSDKGYRKFFTRLHVLSQIYFQVSDLKSLRDLGETMREDERVQGVLATTGVDNSNISRANEQRSFAVFRYLFHSLFPKALGGAASALGSLATLEKVKILDGSLIRCGAAMAWATYRKTKNGVKVHLLLDWSLLPEKLVVTAGNGSKRDILRQVPKRGVTCIFDRGYNCYDLFAQMSRTGAFFVTRLLDNAVYEIVEMLPLGPEACAGCGDCVERCPFGALVVPDDVCVVDAARCVGCGLCATVCPADALHLERRPEGEIPLPPADLVDWMTQRARERGL